MEGPAARAAVSVLAELYKYYLSYVHLLGEEFDSDRNLARKSGYR